MAPLPTLCWHSLIACRCACSNRTVAHVAKVLWPTSCLLRRHPCRCQASARSVAPNGQGHRGSGWGQDPGAAACVLCPLHVRLAISRGKANASCLFAATSLFGCIPAPLFPRLAPVPWPQEAKAAKAWSGAGTLAPMLASRARLCRAASMPCGIAVVRPALSPLWLWHRHHCTLQWCRDSCCNGAVAPHCWHHHPCYNGAVAHATLALGRMSLPSSLAHAAKVPWSTLLPFAFALARSSSADCLCHAGGVNCSGARCIVAHDAMAPLPTLRWRHPVSHVALVATGLNTVPALGRPLH